MANREMTRKNKKKLLKEQKYVSEEEHEIRRFIIILLSIVVIIVLIYVVSNIFIKKNSSNSGYENKAGEVDYNVVSVGTMLNRNDDEYYVMVYSQEGSSSTIYATYGGMYTSKTDAKKLYYLDLNNEINKPYVAKDGKSNPDAKSIDEFKFGEFTLLKIKKGKVVKYLEDVDTIKKELGI